RSSRRQSSARCPRRPTSFCASSRKPGADMHESSLAKNVLDAVLARASADRATRVIAARGFLADVEAIDPESLAFHFAAHARGTIAEGARLEIARTLVKARCLSCRTEFEPGHLVALC